MKPIPAVLVLKTAITPDDLLSLSEYTMAVRAESAEAMRAKCEAIARDEVIKAGGRLWDGSRMAHHIADAIADLKHTDRHDP